jgi:prepilin-type N-terminal cleavage/methylation domain-containing protein
MKRTRRSQGFTLLEVLAAVMVFSVWFTAIASAVMASAAREMRSHHHIEASLLADRALADVEASMLVGVPALFDGDAYSDDVYEVSIEQRPFDISGALDAGALPAGLDASALLPGGSLPLLQIDIEVVWLDGFAEVRVTRRGYVLDPAALQSAAALFDASAAAALPPAATPPAPSGDTGS